jgi:hypothetical protein
MHRYRLASGIAATAVAIAAAPLSALAAHPQTVFDQAGLNNLRALRGDAAHSSLTSFAQQFLTANSVANSGSSCPPDLNQNAITGGYAVLAEILQQNVSDAVAYFNCFCTQAWSTTADQDEGGQLIGAAIAYDVLYNESGLDRSCASKIAAAAADFYDAYTNPANPNGWWRDDIANGHLSVNMAALGIAAEALKGENANATTWLSAVDAAFQKIAAVQDYSTDGSWHEGDGYRSFFLHWPAFYHLGAARAGNPDRSATRMYLNSGKYILQKQQPNNPRLFSDTHGEWNWVRPPFLGILRFVAGHLASSDPTLAGYAQTAANRWDLLPRSAQGWLKRFEYVLAYALEYLTFDENVAPIEPAAALPLAVYNDNEGTFVMRSSWGVATTGSDSKGIVLTLKNGYLGGKGMAQAVASCSNIPSAGTSWFLNFGHDHYDDFGLYIYGNGGWLLPEATGYNCCGTGPAGDPNGYHNTFWHNTVTFDGSTTSNGNGQILDDWITARGVHGSTVSCGRTTDSFFSRVPSNPFHHNTQDFAIGQADGSQLYRNVALGRALRTVGFDRETNVIVLSDEIAFSSGTHTIQQHFHSMKAATSMVDANRWLKLDNSTGPAGETVPISTTVLAIKVIAPSDASLPPVDTQSSNAYTEWMSPDGNYGHFVVGTPGLVSGRRFLELLWPTDTASYANRPNATALDAANPERGLSVPIPSGGSETWILNTVGSTTAAGAFSIAGSSTSDVGVARYDSAGALLRTMAEGSSGARLSDTNGTRLLLDLNGSAGAMEVRYEASGAYVVSADQNGTPMSINAQRFYAASAPSSVKYNGTVLTSSQYSYDPASSLVTISSSPPPPTAPQISNVAASQITSSSAQISWNTDQAADSQVRYGLTASYGSSTTLDPALVTIHGQTLSGLSASTTYHYSVTSRNSGGLASSSPDATFTTLGTSPPVASLTDTFGGTSVDTTKWTVTQNLATVTEASGSLNITPNANTGSAWGYVASVGTYTLVGSSAAVQAVSVVSSGGNVDNQFSLLLDGSNYVQWLYQQGTLYGISIVGGVRTNVAVLTYDSVAHAWWRIRESAGTTYWETTADGSAWTQRGTATTASLFPLNSIKVTFYVETFGAGLASPGQARYANLNTPPPACNGTCLSTLRDTFGGTAIDSSKWAVTIFGGGSATEGGGTLNINPPANNPSSQIQVESVNAYSLQGSFAQVKVPQVVSQGCGVNNSLIVASTSGVNRVEWWVECGNLYANYYINGASTHAATLAYSATNHLWWRIRETSGTVYWETSSDGTAWTVRASKATNTLFPVNSVKLWLYSETYSSLGSPGQGKYANLN